MYGIATKQSKKKVETMNLEKVKELIQKSLKKIILMKKNQMMFYL